MTADPPPCGEEQPATRTLTPGENAFIEQKSDSTASFPYTVNFFLYHKYIMYRFLFLEKEQICKSKEESINCHSSHCLEITIANMLVYFFPLFLFYAYLFRDRRYGCRYKTFLLLNKAEVTPCVILSCAFSFDTTSWRLSCTIRYYFNT